MYNYNYLRGWKIKPILMEPQIKMHNFKAGTNMFTVSYKKTVLIFVAKFSF